MTNVYPCVSLPPPIGVLQCCWSLLPSSSSSESRFIIFNLFTTLSDCIFLSMSLFFTSPSWLSLLSFPLISSGSLSLPSSQLGSLKWVTWAGFKHSSVLLTHRYLQTQNKQRSVYTNKPPIYVFMYLMYLTTNVKYTNYLNEHKHTVCKLMQNA